MGDYARRPYHSQHPSWRAGNHLDEGSYIGIEFEVLSSGYDYQRILDLLPDFSPDNRPITEADGSLGDHGVEIIFPPVNPAELKKASSVFARAIKAIEPEVQHNFLTGMHMNVNCRGWTARRRALFGAIINNMSDAHLANIGGRTPTRYCAAQRGMSLDYYNDNAGSHCGAAEAGRSRGRIEVRFPQSTTDHEKIKVLVDFLTCLEEFTDKHLDAAISQITVNRIPPFDPQYDYSDIVDLFYDYLTKTKKGKRVLAVLEKGYEAAFADQAADKAKRRSTNSTEGARPARPAFAD